MTLVVSEGLVLSAAEAALPAGTPIIGWENIVTSANIGATTSAVGFPFTNMANPSTNLKWRSTQNNDVVAVVNLPAEEIDYIGIAGHNFGTSGAPIQIQGGVANTFQKVMLHFDGTDGSTTITDSNSGGSAHTWTANGNAQIDDATSAFGGASLLCDGTGDYVTTPDHADFALGTGDFTIQGFFFIAVADGAGGVLRRLAGQADSGLTAASSSFHIERLTTNFLRFTAFVGGTSFAVTSTSQYTGNTNTGMHHFRITRTGGNLYLAINGIVQATTAITGSINNSAAALSVGRAGEVTTNTWFGNIDEFEILVGVAASGATNFVRPAIASGAIYFSNLMQDFVAPNDSPMIIQFTPTSSLSSILVWMQPGSQPPEMAVVYVGKLLIMERGIDINVEHIPMPYGRRFNIATGMSESGNFLGRVVTQEHRETKAEFKWITPSWYRETMDPFIAACPTTPFFWAWNPDEYPDESGYGWMINEPMPETDPVTRRVNVTLEFKGVA